MKFSAEWVRTHPDEAAARLELYHERIVSLETALGAEKPGDREGSAIVLEPPVGRAMLRVHNPA